MSKFTRYGYEHPCRRYRADWRRFRKAQLARAPLCAKCGRVGNQVDHIKPLHKIAPWDRITRKELLDATNVQTLCRSCHDEKTARENTTGKPRPKFCACGHPWVGGQPICGRAECAVDDGGH